MKLDKVIAKILTLLVIVVSIATSKSAFPQSSGCGRAAPLEEHPYLLNVGGNTIGGSLNREYEVFLPPGQPGYDINTPTPLVFYYHNMGVGNLTNGEGIQSEWQGLVRPIVVSPRSLTLNPENLDEKNGDEGRAWNLNLDWADVEFIRALKQHLLETYCIDEDQIFTFGGSSGGFGALGTGCHNHMSAIVSERGAILHPNDAVSRWGFPLTPVPADQACGPIPTLLGYADENPGDTVVDYFIYGEPTIDFFVANNNCNATSQPDQEAEVEICDINAPLSCQCDRYDNCIEDLTVCTWDGGHTTSSITAEDAAWFFARSGAYSSRPACHHERFDGGAAAYQWEVRSDGGFNAYFHSGKERLHVTVPRSPYPLPYWYPQYYEGAYARFAERVWDVPLLKDFSVSMTVTNLKYNFPEVRLNLSSHEALPMIEIRTFFINGRLRAQAYNREQPVGSSWPITRSGPGGTRLWNGACWMVHGDPITDRVTVYSRNIDSNNWPNCTGSWTQRTSFINPFYTQNPSTLYDYDYNSTPIKIHIGVGRHNNNSASASKDGYVRIDDVYIGRDTCGSED